INFLLEDKDLAKEDILIAKDLDAKELLRKLKTDYIEKKLIPTSLANLILNEIEDLKSLFTNEEKEILNTTLQSFHIS
ncbi:MAG: hypothetical protein ACXABK_01035, partial [Candidatus Heimdallarchaeaceae archaeon]